MDQPINQPINQPIRQMTDQERPERINELLWQAAALEGEALAEFLDRACAGDAELRREVENMLGGEVDTREILKHSPATGWRRQAQADALRTGEKISHYRIESRIGRGGMGEVYLARDERLRRPVAIKILPPEFSVDPDRVRRFEQEAFAASRLNHPNIITIFDIIHDGDNHFIAAEFVDGQTLRQAINDGRFSLRKKLAIAVQIAEALSVAHEAGIVHRDIKPENVMLRRDGYVKVLDFGIAKSSEQPAPESAALKPPLADFTSGTGALMGTVSYMSPEQARGERVDARTDIFSLGVVLYEMIAGRKPFEGETNTEVVKAIFEKEPPPLSQSARDAPPALQRIIDRATQKDRENRYQTAAEMLGDLQSLKERLARAEPRLSRRAWIAMAASGAALIATVAVWGLRNSSGRAQVDLTPRVFRIIADGKVEEADVSPDGQHIAYTTYKGKTRNLLVRELETSGDLEIVAPGAGHDCQSPTFSPDGRSVYYLSFDAKSNLMALYQIPATGGAPRKLIEGVDSPVAISPDGSRIAFVREDIARQETSLMTANADGGGLQRLAIRRDRVGITGGRPAWAPDGKRIAFAAGSAGEEGDTRIYQVSASGGGEETLSPHRLGNIQGLAWLKDDSGMILLAADPSGNTYHVWYLVFDGDRLRKLTYSPYNNRSLGVTADGNNVVTVQQDEVRSLWVMPSGDSSRARQLITGQTAGKYGIAWTPDNKIIYAGGPESAQELWIMGADGGGNRRFSFDAEDDDAPTVPRDGRYVVYSSIRTSGRNNVWRMDRDGGNPKQLTFGKTEVDPECSPDGKWVVYVSWDDNYKGSIWRVPIDGGPPAQLTAGHITNPSPAISPDGKLLSYSHALPGGDRVKWIEIVPFDDQLSLGRKPVKTLPLPETANHVHWAPDGRAVVYVEIEGGVANLWRAPIDGGPRRRLTDFKSDTISWFAWSLDGKQLALSRLTANRDVINLESFR